MPECGGLDVVRRLPTDTLPVVAFVTAFDDFAVEAFELNAIDYLLKPPQLPRMQAMIERARQRLASREPAEVRAAALTNAAASYERASRRVYLERIPVRRRDEVFILPVRQIAYVMADGELLHFHTVTNERHTIAHRLHALEARLDPRRFVRLGRGIIVNVELVTKLSPMPGGTLTATLSNGVELPVSRIQTRLLRETLLKL
jgi:two-component system LytT family response regulator